MKRILRNPRYVGIVAWGVTERRPSAQDSKRRRTKLRPGGPLVVGEIPPLVDKATWDAVNAIGATVP